MQAICLILSLWLILGSAAYFVPRTPRGIHCPTAPVQTVAQLVTLTGDNGESTSEIVYRKPVEGDKDFVQCHCAEKKSEQQQPVTQARTYEAPVFALTVSKPFAPVIALILSSSGALPVTEQKTSDWHTAPLVPPPNFI